MSITKNSKSGRWQARFRDSSGKQQQFTGNKYFPAGTSKPEAEKIEYQIKELIEQSIAESVIPYLEDMLDDWLENHAQHLTGYSHYVSHANQIRPFLKNKKIIHVVDACKEIIKDGKRRGLANSTLKHRLNPLRQIAKEAYIDDLILTDLHSKIPTLETKSNIEVYINMSQVREVADAAPTDLIKNLILFFALTGIRLGEVTRIRDGDLFADRITIRGKQKGENHKLRSYTLNPEAIECAKKIGFPLHITHSTLCTHMSRIKANNTFDFEFIGWHTLRHSFATMLAQTGAVTLSELQYLMGHATITMTMKYNHHIPSQTQSVVTAFDIINKGKTN